MKGSAKKATPARYVAPWERRGKIVARQRLEKSDAPCVASLVPDCPRCGNSLVWRGRWRCDACPAEIGWTEYESRDGERVAQPEPLGGAALERAPIFSSSELNNWPSSRADRTKRAAWLAWLEQVELYTSVWRKKRAARHRWKAAPSPDRPVGSKWHEVRALGQAERFERVAMCGAVRFVQRRHTSEGTAERNLEYRCDCWRVCKKCLERRRFRLTSGLEVQRKRAFAIHAHRLRRGYAGAEGRWSEKLITLTVPHGSSPGGDARVLTKAWRELSRKIATHLKKDRECEASPVWVRALEVAPGATGGHAHLHLWWFGPFLDHAWLRVTFGRILEGMGVKCPEKPWDDAVSSAVDARFSVWGRTRRGVHGREVDAVPWPVVDLGGRSSAAVGRYASKVGIAFYVTKGTKNQRLSPMHAASIYQALEGSRCVQWARGWAPKREPQEGVTYSRRRLTAEEEQKVNESFVLLDVDALQRLDKRAAMRLRELQESQQGDTRCRERSVEQLLLLQEASEKVRKVVPRRRKSTRGGAAAASRRRRGRDLYV